MSYHGHWQRRKHRIGFLIGAGNLDLARATAGAILKFAIGYALIVSVTGMRFVINWSYLHHRPGGYLSGCTVAAVYCGVSNRRRHPGGTVSALRGYKDTAVPMLISLVSYWLLALPLGYALAEGLLGDSPLGVYGYWTGLTVALSVVGIGAGLRLRYISSDYDRIANLTAAEANAAPQI